MFSEPPSFITHLGPLEVSVGDYTTLHCQVSGTPEITISWYKGDTILRSTPEHKMYFKDNVATLIFNKVDISDSGEYICKAENSVGSASSNAILTVQGDKFILSCLKMQIYQSLPLLQRISPVHLDYMLVILQNENVHLLL